MNIQADIEHVASKLESKLLRIFINSCESFQQNLVEFKLKHVSL